MQQATRVVLVRHGQTAWNVGTRLQGHLDIPLDPHGLWQASRAADALAGEGLQAVYSSDLLRARATADALALRTGLEVHDEPALRERAFGRFEGLTYAEIDATWPGDALRWRLRDPLFTPPEGGENLVDFSARCVEVAARLAARHPGEAIALVTHGGVLDSLYRAAVGLPLQAPRSWVLGNATINRLLCVEGRFTLVGWNDDAHLQQAPAGDSGETV